MVKDLIVGGGATLVYDSLTQESALPIPPSSLSLPSYPNHHQQQQSTMATNKASFTLTPGKQHPTDSPSEHNHSITSVTMPTKTRYDSVSVTDIGDAVSRLVSLCA